MKQFYPYFPDDSGFKAPEWQTRRALMKPLLEKSPWLAVWDRHVRKLVRLAIRMGELQGCSPLENVYDQHTKGDLMTLAELAQVWNITLVVLMSSHIRSMCAMRTGACYVGLMCASNYPTSRLLETWFDAEHCSPGDSTIPSKPFGTGPGACHTCILVVFRVLQTTFCSMEGTHISLT